MGKTARQIFHEVGNFIHSFKNFFDAPTTTTTTTTTSDSPTTTMSASMSNPYFNKNHPTPNHDNNPHHLLMNNIFPQASKLIQDARQGQQDQGGGVCVKVCSFDGGVVEQHLAEMGDTLAGIQRSLMTVEYCLLIFTFLCTVAVFIGVFVGFVWSIRSLWRECRWCARGKTSSNGYPYLNTKGTVSLESSKEDQNQQHRCPSRISNEYAQIVSSTLERRGSSKSTAEEEYEVIGNVKVPITAQFGGSFQRGNSHPRPPPRPSGVGPGIMVEKLKIHQGDDD